MIAPGDRFSAQAVYSEGATSYPGGHPPRCRLARHRRQQRCLRQLDRRRLRRRHRRRGRPGCAPTSVQLTTAWSFSAAFEHFWTPALRTSVYGSYIDVSHNATANDLMCTSALGVAPVAAAAVRLQHGLERLEHRFAHPVGARSRSHHGRGRDLQQARTPPRSRTRPATSSTRGAILANSAGRDDQQRRRRLDRHVPHPARLRSLIVRASRLLQSEPPAVVPAGGFLLRPSFTLESMPWRR